jgi:hypothetical protein
MWHIIKCIYCEALSPETQLKHNNYVIARILKKWIKAVQNFKNIKEHKLVLCLSYLKDYQDQKLIL